MLLLYLFIFHTGGFGKHCTTAWFHLHFTRLPDLKVQKRKTIPAYATKETEWGKKTKTKTLASATLCVQAGGKKSYLFSLGFYLPGWAGTGITERQATARGISRSTDKIRPPEEDYISDNAIKLSTQLDPECTHYADLPHTALELAHGEFTRQKDI